MMELKITQIGNSLGVIVPDAVASSLELKTGDSVWITNRPQEAKAVPDPHAFETQVEHAKDRASIVKSATI